MVGATDPNPLVSGRGVRALRRAGVEVILAPGPWRRRAEEQNAKFRTFMETGRPLVLAKWASTLDGRIASAKGESRWITGEAARRRALLLREEYDAVLVGAGTVRADDPRLTRRLGRAGRLAHWRIVLDGRLRLSETARVLRGPGERVVATAAPASHPKARRLAARGIRIWSLPASPSKSPGGRVDLSRLLRMLARHGVTSLMVEGGAETLGEFFRAGLVDRVAVFLAPRVLGGERATGAVGGAGFPLGEAPGLSDLRVERVGRGFARDRPSFPARPIDSGHVHGHRGRSRNGGGEDAAARRGSAPEDPSAGGAAPVRLRRERLRLRGLPDRRARRPRSRGRPLARDAETLDAREPRARREGQRGARAALGRPALGPLRDGARGRDLPRAVDRPVRQLLDGLLLDPPRALALRRAEGLGLRRRREPDRRHPGPRAVRRGRHPGDAPEDDARPDREGRRRQLRGRRLRPIRSRRLTPREEKSRRLTPREEKPPSAARGLEERRR